MGMFGKSIKNPKIKLIVSAVSTLLLGIAVTLSVVTYFNSSFGWFSRNNDVRGSDMGVNVQKGALDVEFTYFKYDVNDETYTLENNLSTINFNQYDLVFRSRNQYTPVVVRLELKKSELSESGGTLTAKIYRDTTKIVSNNKIDEFSSSVMRFTPFIGSTYYSADTETQFKNVHNAHFTTTRALTGDDVPSGSQVFTDVDYTGSTVNSVTKDDYVSLTFTYSSEDFNGDKLYAYIYITYDEGYNAGSYNGLTGIYTKTAGITTIGDEHVTFANDFVSIKVEQA